MMELKSPNCVVCQTPVSQGLTPWHFACRACRYEGTSLEPAINESSTHQNLDEGDREIALMSLRKESFKAIITRALAYVPSGRLLDVGSAHGWFLEEANKYYETLGLEPDRAVFLKTASRGLNVKNGYFPDALEADDEFNIIVFNDVIEHIPNIEQALRAVHSRLTTDGILVLNLPNSSGVFYYISKILTRLGMGGPFERMWQKGLPSPHVHYFNSENLEQLVHREGFTTLEQFELPSVRAEGLLERIRCVGGQGKLKSYFQFVVIRMMIPFLRLFQSDIIVAIFKKR